MNVVSELIRIFGLQSEQQLQIGDERFGVGGYLSFRREVTITRSSEPLHVFVKTSDKTRKELAHMQEISNQYCRNECVFYGVMAPIVDCALARCQLSPVYPRVYSQRFCDTGSVLVMENLQRSGYRQVDGNQMSVAQAECAVKKMATLQAAFWVARSSFDYTMDDAIFGWESPFKNYIGETGQARGVDFSPLMPTSREYFNEHISSRVRRPEDEQIIKESAERLWDRLMVAASGKSLGDSSRPLGLKHSDLWYPNVLFKDDGESLTCRIIDWQGFSVDLFGIDIAMLLITSLPHEHAMAEFDRLVMLHYTTFKETFERSTGQPVPFSEKEARGNVFPSLVYAFFWFFISCDSIWESNGIEVGDVVASLAQLLQTVQEEPNH